MLTTRLNHSSTYENAQAVLSLLNDDRTDKVTFFATEATATDAYLEQGGLANNLPLVVVLATGRLLGPIEMHVVCDSSDFLMATRMPRLAEVKSVTDAAAKTAKAFFSRDRVPFTGDLSPEEARDVLRGFQTERLTAETVSEYRQQLNPTASFWE